MAKPAHLVPLGVQWTELSRLATHLAHTPAALIVQMASEGPLMLAVSGLPADQQKAGVELCAAVSADAALNGLLPDAAQLDKWRDHPLVRLLKVRFCMVLALSHSQADQPAWLGLLDTEPRGPEELAAIRPGLQALVTHAGHLQDMLFQQQQSAFLTRGREERLGNALHESESRLNLTEHTAGVGSWSVDIASGWLQHSDEFSCIMGMAPGEAMEDLAAMVQRYTPECRAAMRQRLGRCAESGEAFDEEIQVQVPGAGPKWVRTVGNAVRDAQGRIVRIQGAVQDCWRRLKSDPLLGIVPIQI